MDLFRLAKPLVIKAEFMSYFKVTNASSFESKIYEVSLEEIQKFLRAKNTLASYLEMEILYDQLIEEFWEYRNKVNYWCMRAVTAPNDYIFNHQIRSSLNRLCFNLLNISKLYLDRHYNERQDTCFVYEITKCSAAKQQVVMQRSEIYDNNLGYVIGCKLRNRSQHRKLPVSSFSKAFKNNLNEKKIAVQFTIGFSYEDLIELRVPSSRLEVGKKYDLTGVLNEYIFAISQMHFMNRKIIDSVVEGELKYIQACLDKYGSQSGYDEFFGEYELENNKPIYAGLEWYDVTNYLKSKHGYEVNFSTISIEN